MAVTQEQAREALLESILKKAASTDAAGVLALAQAWEIVKHPHR